MFKPCFFEKFQVSHALIYINPPVMQALTVPLPSHLGIPLAPFNKTLLNGPKTCLPSEEASTVHSGWPFPRSHTIVRINNYQMWLAALQLGGYTKFLRHIRHGEISRATKVGSLAGSARTLLIERFVQYLRAPPSHGASAVTRNVKLLNVMCHKRSASLRFEREHLSDRLGRFPGCWTNWTRVIRGSRWSVLGCQTGSTKLEVNLKTS